MGLYSSIKLNSCAILVPLSLLEELFAWPGGPLLLGQKKHWNGQKIGFPLFWVLSERQFKAFKTLAAYPRARLSHECSFCSLAFIALPGKRIVWSCECHALTWGAQTPDITHMSAKYCCRNLHCLLM